MTTYRVSWGRGDGAAVVTTVAELDAVLDTITTGPTGLPYSVSVFVDNGDDFPPMIDICVGDPDTSFAYHVAADGSSAWGYEPGVPPQADLVFDYAGQATDAWPERTRVTPGAARQAAREFVTLDGERPVNLQWDLQE
jgi:hypothetical protein